MSERLRSTYSRFIRLKVSISFCLLREGAHDAHAGQVLLHARRDVAEVVLHRLEADVDALRRSTSPARRRPARRSAPAAPSSASMRSIITNAPVTTSSDETECMTAGPISMRTEERSFVARDIRSPVRCSW